VPLRRERDVARRHRVLADPEDGADEAERLGEPFGGDLPDDAPPDGLLEDVDRRLDLLEVEPLRVALARDLAGVDEDGLEVPLADGVLQQGVEAGEAPARLVGPRRLVAGEPAAGQSLEGLGEDRALLALEEVEERGRGGHAVPSRGACPP
jgi:hypothetical protein